MKVRWREHELIFVTAMLAVTVIGYWRGLLNVPNITEQTYRFVYAGKRLPFTYYVNVLLPQTGVAVLFYLCYLLINRVAASSVKKIASIRTKGIVLKKLILIISAVAGTAFLLALGINIAAYYAHPWWFNYGGFGMLAFCGYNEHPLTNIFFGVDRALVAVGLCALFVCLREAIAYYIENPGTRSSYRVLIANQVSVFLVVYLSVPLFLLTFKVIKNGFFESRFATVYFAFILPAFVVFMGNTYWVFPAKEGGSFFNARIILRLLFSTFIGVFPLVFFFVFINAGFVFLESWAFQLLIVTPVSWIFYQQRRDKILQLQGLEKRLEKSKAHFQFLRSQINPHFLFNTLNTLYGCALLENAVHTAEGIQKLGDMMRFMLHENHLDFIPMRREIEYLENYISLQKLRVLSTPEIVIDTEIDEKKCGHNIAPMLLIPFVENAFKHGISLTEKSWIKIKLGCDNNTIHFEVHNSNHPHKNNDPEKDKSGIGLNNVEERLKLIYPGKHSFSAQTEGNEFVVKLSVQT